MVARRALLCTALLCSAPLRSAPLLSPLKDQPSTPCDHSGETYKLFWPEGAEESDFARVAARFGATIVPVAAIGAEEGFEMLLDADEVLALPVLGERAAEGAKRTPVGRKGERFVSPIALPKPPGRFYFLFGAPIATGGVDPTDKEACAALYQQVRAELETSLSYLLEQRKKDPYESLLPRAAVEATWNYTRQVPTFRLPQMP